MNSHILLSRDTFASSKMENKLIILLVEKIFSGSFFSSHTF